MKRFLVFCLFALFVLPVSAQEIHPEDVGFTAFSVPSDSGSVDIYVSTQGIPADTLQTLPLVVYLQGSGYAPIFSGSKSRLSHVLMLKPNDFPGFHYVVIGKPYAPFWAPEQEKPPRAYHEALTLDKRAKDVVHTIDFLTTRSWVDTSMVVVVGHSEGAQVAPAAAAKHHGITHVAALAASGLSQAFDFVLEIRRRVRMGELSFEEGEAEIARLHDMFRQIEASPTKADSFWRGHSHRRWSSFFESPLAAFLSLDIPIFVAVGTKDVASPIESADYLPIAFIRAGKENLTYRVWPTDHRFQERLPEGNRVDRRPEVMDALLQWLEN